MAKINGTRKIHMTPSMVKGHYSIRMCVCYEHAKAEDLERCWKIIQACAEEALSEEKSSKAVDKKYLRQSFSMETKAPTQQRLSDFATPIAIPQNK
jgi:hypothetical protein